jgi:hypothetical protein
VSSPIPGGGGSAGRGNAPGAATTSSARPTAAGNSQRAASSAQRSGAGTETGATAARGSVLSGGDRNRPTTETSRFASAYPVARTRRARLRVAHVDPWTVMKLSFLLSIALGIMMFIAAAVLWTILDMLGVFEAVGSTVSDVTGSGDDTGFDVGGFLSLSRVLGFTTLVSIIDVVLITALGTIGAWLYNISADFVGGIEVTFAEEE